MSNKQAKKSNQDKSKLKSWTQCAKCSISYIKPDSDEHSCPNTLNSLFNESNKQFFLFKNFLYLNLIEQSKGIFL